MKRFISMVLCFVTLLIATFPVYASSIITHTNNVNTTNTSFSISSTGNATVCGISFAQTMYFRYDSQKGSFNILSTLKDNIYNKVAWVKLAER